MRGRMSGAQTATTQQLLAGIAGRVRSMRRGLGNADGAPVRSAGQMEFRHRFLRRLGLVRRTLMHSLHSKSVRHFGGSLLGDHQTAGVWCEEDTTADDVVRGARVAGRRLHFTAATADYRQRAFRRRWQRDVRRVSELRLPDLRDVGLVLHSVVRNAVRLLPDLSSRPPDCDGRTKSPHEAGERHQWWREGEEGVKLGDHRIGRQHLYCDRFATPAQVALPVSQRAQGFDDAGHHNVGVHRLLAALFYISFSATVLGRQPFDASLNVHVAGLCEFAAQSDNLCDIESGLPQAVPGDTVLPVLQPQSDDARRLLSQSVRRASVPACDHWW